MAQKYSETYSAEPLRKLKWRLYRMLALRFPKQAARLKPKLADVEGERVEWFGLHCVQRRQGGGTIAVGDNCRVEGALICERPDSKIVLGAQTSIGGATTIAALGNVLIGDDCLISYQVLIQDHDGHSVYWEHRSQDVRNWLAGVKDWTYVPQADINIGSRCWIGAKSIVLKGVTLGEGCVIGAGSVVTRSFPPHSLVAGNPAVFIRSIRRDTYGCSEE